MKRIFITICFLFLTHNGITTMAFAEDTKIITIDQIKNESLLVLNKNEYILDKEKGSLKFKKNGLNFYFEIKNYITFSSEAKQFDYDGFSDINIDKSILVRGEKETFLIFNYNKGYDLNYSSSFRKLRLIKVSSKVDPIWLEDHGFAMNFLFNYKGYFYNIILKDDASYYSGKNINEFWSLVNHNKSNPREYFIIKNSGNFLFIKKSDIKKISRKILKSKDYSDNSFLIGMSQDEFANSNDLNRIKELSLSINSGKVSKDNFKNLYKWVIDNISYDEEAGKIIDSTTKMSQAESLETIQNNLSNPIIHSGIKVFKNGTGVCDGITKLLYYLTYFSGIKGYELVNGYYTQNGIKTLHSRIEKDGRVYDPTFDLGVKQPKFFGVKREPGRVKRGSIN